MKKPLPRFNVLLAAPDAYDDLRELALEAIGGGPSKYDEAQTAAWLANMPDRDDWHARIERQSIFVGFNGSRACGFMTLTPRGLIDFAFIRPGDQGCGLFRLLLARVEGKGRALRLEKLFTKASLNAQGPFQRGGFIRTYREQPNLNGIMLERFHMEKKLR